MFSEIAWNFSISVRNWKRKKANWKKINPSKFTIGHVEGDFDNPTLKNFNKRQKLSRSICKIEMKQILSQNSIFLENVPNGHSECSFGRPAENFSTITEKISLKLFLFRKKNHSSGRKIFFREMFLWTRSYKISQPRRNFSGRGWTTLQQRPKVIN